MRLPMLILGAAGLLLTACEQAPTRILASAAPDGGGNVTALAVRPVRTQILIGSTVQLTTNAPAAYQSQIQWLSLQPSIAAVTASGVVSGLAAGTAVVQARFAFDTTQAATATVTVIGPAAPATGGTTGG